MEEIPLYSADYSTGSGTGFVLGGAYERPDIALRVALTYSSEIDLELGSNGAWQYGSDNHDAGIAEP